MEIDSEEQEAPKDVNFSTLYFHPLNDKEESVEPTRLVDMLRDVAVIKKRPTWLCDILQEVERLIVRSKR